MSNLPPGVTDAMVDRAMGGCDHEDERWCETCEAETVWAGEREFFHRRLVSVRWCCTACGDVEHYERS